MSSKNYEANSQGLDLDLLLAVIQCFISYVKWVQREQYPLNIHLPYYQENRGLNN